MAVDADCKLSRTGAHPKELYSVSVFALQFVRKHTIYWPTWSVSCSHKFLDAISHSSIIGISVIPKFAEIRVFDIIQG